MSLPPESFEPTRVVFLDRDGVINQKASEEDYYVQSSADLEILPDVPEAIRLLNRSGILVIVITNQRGVALGHLTDADLQEIHKALQARLAEASAHLDAIYYCPHDYDECDCRKPKTGMLERAFSDFPVATRDNSVLIGDSLSDIAAGKSFGIRTILITGNEERIKSDHGPFAPDATAASLLDAAERIVAPGATGTSKC